MMGMEMSWFRDGKLGVYELMTEEAGVNFWEVHRSLPVSPFSSVLRRPVLTVAAPLALVLSAILLGCVPAPLRPGLR